MPGYGTQFDEEMIAQALASLPARANARASASPEVRHEPPPPAPARGCDVPQGNMTQGLATATVPKPADDRPAAGRSWSEPEAPAPSPSHQTSVGEPQPAFDITGFAPEKSDTERWQAIKWTLAGFIFGVAFWHLVGFWGFVRDVVLDERHVQSEAGRRPLPGPVIKAGETTPGPGRRDNRVP